MKQIHLASAESPGTSLINLTCGLGIFDIYFFPPLSCSLLFSQPQPRLRGKRCIQRCSSVCCLPWARNAQFGGKTPQGTLEPPGDQPVTPKSFQGIRLVRASPGKWVPSPGAARQRSRSFKPGLFIYGLYLYTSTSLPRHEASEGLPKQLRDNCDDK